MITHKQKKSKKINWLKQKVLAAIDLHLVAVAFSEFRCRRFSRTNDMYQVFPVYCNKIFQKVCPHTYCSENNPFVMSLRAVILPPN